MSIKPLAIPPDMPATGCTESPGELAVITADYDKIRSRLSPRRSDQLIMVQIGSVYAVLN